MPRVDSPELCQRFCADSPGCEYFTHSLELKECSLKGPEAIDSREERNQTVSGPARCPGERFLTK